MIRLGNATGSVAVAQPSRWTVAQPLLLVALAGVLANACTESQVTPRSDAAATDGGDAGIIHCQQGMACDDNTVRSCDHGVVGRVLKTCDDGQTCSAGQCTSLACAAAERMQTLAGCLLYGALADNTDRDDALPSTIIVVNPAGEDTNADLQVLDDVRFWRTIQTVHVPAFGAEHFALPNRHLEGVGVGKSFGFRVQSDRPLTATLIESDDSTEMAESTGGTMLLPNHALGNDYMVMTYPQRTAPPLAATPGSHDGAGQIVLVATADETTVTVRLSSTASMVAGAEVPSIGPGESFQLTLNDGDLLQLRSRDEGTDLSGTVVSADNPLAVFSGNIFTAYGRAAPGINSPDLALEEMLPLRSWSQTYVAARLGPQKDTCDSLFGGGSALWRILAARDDTHVTFEAAPGAGGGLPAGELVLAEGEVRELLVPSAGSFLIKGSKPILVTQGMDCEGTLSSGVPTDSLWSEFRFALPAHFDHEVMVVRKDTGPVILDGTPIDDALFQPVGGAFQAARIAIPACVGPPRNCLHLLEGTFGLTLRGMDVLCGYALTPFTWTRCGAFAGPDCIP